MHNEQEKKNTGGGTAAETAAEKRTRRHNAKEQEINAATADSAPQAAQDTTDDSEKKIAQLQSQLEEKQNLLLRTAAEYDNYRKRTDKEKNSSVEYGMTAVIEKMLPVLDNLERAADAECADAEYKKGVEMTLKNFRDTLESLGCSEIPALGEAFDPNVHSAVAQIEGEGAASGTVTAVMQKGYRLHERVVRHAMVAVAP